MKTSTFFLLIVVAGAILQNRDKLEQWINPPPTIVQGSANNEVILYSTTWCGYCAKTRQYLTKNNIKYNDIDVENSEKGRSDYKRLGGNGVPIIVINNETVIHGYNLKKIGETLNKS